MEKYIYLLKKMFSFTKTQSLTGYSFRVVLFTVIFLYLHKKITCLKSWWFFFFFFFVFTVMLLLRRLQFITKLSGCVKQLVTETDFISDLRT